MISCKVWDLATRARQRGYTFAEVEACIAFRNGDQIVVDENHASYPRNKPGLGDMVASGLAAVGITKERAQAVASAVGVKDCGCAGRQAALNRAGYRLGIGTPPPAESGPTG